MERPSNSSHETDSDSESAKAKRRRLVGAVSAHSAEAARVAAELRNMDPRERALAVTVVEAEVSKPKKEKNRGRGKKKGTAADRPNVPEQVGPDRAADSSSAVSQKAESKPGVTAETTTDAKPSSPEFDGGERRLHDGDIYQGEMIIRHDDANEHSSDEEPEATETFAEKVAAAIGLEAQPDQQPTEQNGPELPGVGYPAYEATDTLPPPAAGGGGNVPPTSPPERPMFAAGEPPEPVPPFVPPHQFYQANMPMHTAQMYYQRGQAPQVVTHQSAPAEQMVTKQELKDAEYYAEKRGLSKGVATGVALALYEHFKHRKREKVNRKELKATNKKLNDTNKRYNFERQEQANRQVRMEAQSKAEQQRAQTAEQRFQAAEQRYQTAEQRLQAERQRVQGEQTANVLGESGVTEQLTVPPEHTVQTSAWHSIEVDARTGKAVENPAFQYGREYYHERAQENVPADQRSAAAGEVALMAATNAQVVAPSGSDASLPPAIPNASMQGPPSGVQSPANKQSAGPAGPKQPDPAPIWPWLVALAVIVVCLIVALS